jgi:hypothetical protein
MGTLEGYTHMQYFNCLTFGEHHYWKKNETYMMESVTRVFVLIIRNSEWRSEVEVGLGSKEQFVTMLNTFSRDSHNRSMAPLTRYENTPLETTVQHHMHSCL